MNSPTHSQLNTRPAAGHDLWRRCDPRRSALRAAGAGYLPLTWTVRVVEQTARLPYASVPLELSDVDDYQQGRQDEQTAAKPR